MVFTLVTNSRKKLFAYKCNSIPQGLFRSTNMAAVSLFRSTNMAEMTSCEKDICNVCALECYEVGKKTTVLISLLCVMFPNTVMERRLFSNYFETLLYLQSNINFNVKKNIQPTKMWTYKDVNYTCYRDPNLSRNLNSKLARESMNS